MQVIPLGVSLTMMTMRRLHPLLLFRVCSPIRQGILPSALGVLATITSNSLVLVPDEDAAGVVDEENDGDSNHQRAVKQKQVQLGLEKYAVPAHGIFDHPEQRPNHDKDTGEIQNPHLLAPGSGDAERAGGRGFIDAHMEDDGGYDEEAEDDDLDCEAGHDDVVAPVLVLLGVG